MTKDILQPELIIPAVEPGSVLVFRGPGELIEPALVDGMFDAVASKCGHRDFLLVYLERGATLERLDAEAMRAAGWVRVR